MADEILTVARLKFEADRKALKADAKWFDQQIRAMAKKGTVKVGVSVDRGGLSKGIAWAGSKINALKKKASVKVNIGLKGGGVGGARGGPLAAAGQLLGRLAGKASSASGEVVALGGSLGKIAGPAGSAVAALTLVAAMIVGVGVASIQAADKQLSWAKTLEWATGSQAAATREMEWASETAHRLGADVGGLTDSYAKFIGAAKGSALGLEGARRVFEQTTNSMAVMGASSEKTERVLTALTQVIGKGKLQAEEYRQQIGEASPMAMQAFVKASGLTRAEFEKQMAAGKVLAEDILPKYADALEEMLGDTKPAATASRSFQRVKNAAFELGGALGQELSPVAGEVLDALANLLRESRPLASFWGGELAKVVKGIVGILGDLLKVYDALPDSIAPSIKSVHMLTDELRTLGGLEGVWRVMADGAKMAGADAIELFNDIKAAVGGFVADALDNLSILFLAFEDMPGVGSVARSLADELDVASDAVRGMTRDSIALSESVARGLRDDAGRSLDAFAEKTTQTTSSVVRDFEEAGDGVKGLSDAISRAGERLTESLLTPQERANAKLQEARDLYAQGAIGVETLIRALDKYGPKADKVAKAGAGIDPIRLTKGFKETAKEIDVVAGKVDKTGEGFARAAEAAWLVADAVTSIDEGLASAIGGAAGLMRGFSDLKALQESGAGRGQQAMAGAQFGGQVGQVGAGLGLWQGQRGQSSFGGQMSGDFGEIGATVGGAIGSMFGPIGTVVGSVLGGIVGGAIKSGADEGLAQLRQVGTDVAVRITKDEGGLGGVVGKIGESIGDALAQVEAALGSDIVLGGVGQIVGGLGLSGEGVNLAIKIRDETIAVFVNGMRREFQETSDAVAFAVGELIRSASIEGVSDFMKDALRGLRVDDVAELETTIRRLMEVDLALSGEAVTEVSEAFRQLRTDAAEVKSALRETGAPMSAYVAWENMRIRAILDGVDAMRKSIIGVPDLVGPLEALNREFLASSEVIEKSRASREREAAALLAAAQEREAAADLAAQEGAEFVELGRGLGRLATEMDKAKGTALGAQREANLAREAYEDFVASMDEIPAEIDAAAIAEAINVGAAKGVQGITGAILSAVDAGLIKLDPEERMRLQVQLFEMEKVIQAAQLSAAAVQIEAMLALGQVAGVTRAALLGLLADIPGFIDQVVGAEFKIGGARGGGGGRRRQEREREAEQAARALEDFGDELYKVRLNASSASGTLGDFAVKIREIGQAAQDAAAAGASAEEIAELQRLRFREARREAVGPFAGGRESFRTQFVDIEQERRDRLARAEIVAEAQAEALGVPFERVFSAMEAEISAGADRLRRDLTRGVIDAFGLPLESARQEGQEFGRMLRDLGAAHRAGEISGRRYRDLVGQIQDAQEEAIGGDVVAMLDKYYDEVEGRESFRRQQAEATFEMELAVLRIRFEAMKAEGALGEAAIERIGGFIAFMDENPPDWDKFFGGGSGGIGGARGGGGFGGAVGGSPGTTGLGALLDAIRGFVRGFERIDLGPFSQMADDFTGAIQGFQDDLDQELGTVIDGYTVRGRAQKIVHQVFGPLVQLDDLTAEQLEQLREMDISVIPGFRAGMEDIFDVLASLEDAAAMKPEAVRRILDQYRGVEESTSALVNDFTRITDEFEDVRNALDMMGASVEEFADAAEIYADRLEEFRERAAADVRSVAAEIRGGAFGGVGTEEQARMARERFGELRAQAEAGDLAAVEQLGQAMRDLLAAEQVFTGGFGAEFDFIREQLLQFGEAFEVNLDPAAPPMVTSDPAMAAKADLQIAALHENNKAIRDGQQASDELNRQILEQLVALNARSSGGLPPEGAVL